MTVAAPLPITLHPHELLPDSTAEARKRRREILASQRGSFPVHSAVTTDDIAAKRQKMMTSDIANSKPAPATSIKSTKNSGKKPQMKYDPDIPMSKEEAAAWRREQRRKRNRESAAASRQRQRDRIAELEVQVEDWKSKFESVMEKIRRLEESEIPSKLSTDSHQNVSCPTMSVVVPPTCQSIPPPTASPVTSVDVTNKVTMYEPNPVSEGEEEPQPIKMISRPAVKITGVAPLPLLPEDLLSPEPCLSHSTVVKLEPIDSSLFPYPADKDREMPSLLTDEEKENEFGEFLLDAVHWL